MKEKTHFMAHQPSANYDNRIPYQPLELKKIEQEGTYMDDSDKDETQSPFASKTCLCNNEEIAFQELISPTLDVTKETVEPEAFQEDSGRERLKRHRVEMAGRVWIPDIWGQEERLKDRIDCSAFDAPFVPSRIMTARLALVEEGRRANAGGLRIENRYMTIRGVYNYQDFKNKIGAKLVSALRYQLPHLDGPIIACRG